MRCEYQEKNAKGVWQEKTCQEPGDRRAVDAAGPNLRPNWVGYFCGPHAVKVGERAEPKAVVQCPSCGCRIGVNS